MKQMAPADLVAQPSDVTECPYILDTTAFREQQEKVGMEENNRAL